MNKFLLTILSRQLLLSSATCVALISSCTQTTQRSAKTDLRPKDQIAFMSKVNSIQNNFGISTNAALKDSITSGFNKYALDSLRSVKDWHLIVNEIDQSPEFSSSFAKAMYDLDKDPVYNIRLYSVIKDFETIDPRLDSINAPQADVVYFTYTIRKDERESNLKNHLSLIKTLKTGDTLLVSGSITHIGENLKPDFSEVIEESSSWELDILPTELKKK